MTPTPTPSPTPIWYPNGSPTPTPCWSGCSPWSGGGDAPGGGSGGGSVGFGDEWFTPTPYPTSAATPPIQLTVEMRTLPDQIVQGYNMLNSHQAFDMVWFLVMVMLIVGGVTSVYRRIQAL